MTKTIIATKRRKKKKAEGSFHQKTLNSFDQKVAFMNETILFLNEIIVKPNDKEDSQERIDRVRARVNSSMILNLTVLWCPFLKTPASFSFIFIFSYRKFKLPAGFKLGSSE